jgi:hypothetical protein
MEQMIFDEQAIYEYSRRISLQLSELTPNQQLIILGFTARKINHNALMDDLCDTEVRKG